MALCKAWTERELIKKTISRSVKGKWKDISIVGALASNVRKMSPDEWGEDTRVATRTKQVIGTDTSDSEDEDEDEDGDEGEVREAERPAQPGGAALDKQQVPNNDVMQSMLVHFKDIVRLLNDGEITQEEANMRLSNFFGDMGIFFLSEIKKLVDTLVNLFPSLHEYIQVDLDARTLNFPNGNFSLLFHLSSNMEQYKMKATKSINVTDTTETLNVPYLNKITSLMEVIITGGRANEILTSLTSLRSINEVLTGKRTDASPAELKALLSVGGKRVKRRRTKRTQKRKRTHKRSNKRSNRKK